MPTESERTRVFLILLLSVLALVLVPEPSVAASGRFATLDLITLRSERVAVFVVESKDDSICDWPAGTVGVRYRVVRNLRGIGDVSGYLCLDIWEHLQDIRPGDTLLWLREVRLREGDDDTLRYDHVFDLTDLGRNRNEYAFTRGFRILHDPDSVLSSVTRRIEMIRAGKPLGDHRNLTLVDFALGKGCIEGVNYESEFQDSTDSGSLNFLFYPADADLLPDIMKRTRDPRPIRRAVAAQALANYPGKQTRRRLTELLKDTATSLEIHGRDDGKVDSVWVPVVQRAAQESLRQISAEPPRR